MLNSMLKLGVQEQDTHGIEMKDQYFIDLGPIEVEKAIQEAKDTPTESNDAIRVIEGPEIIELPDNQPVIIEEPKGRRCYGLRYR
jgi:hypothetical protein